MKCDNFKFEYIVAPTEIAGDACEHLQGCATCQLFVEEQRVFDEQLAGVINTATVPDSLRHSLRDCIVTQKKSFWSMPKASMALAASLLMAVGLVNINMTSSGQNDLPIDQLIVEHFSHDGAQAMKASHILEPEQLTKVSELFGVRVRLAKHISFAEKCPIGDSYGLHMVYQYKGAPITVIYMPDISMSATLPFNYAGLQGWVKPLDKGVIAVLGGSTMTLPDEAFADEAIEWL